ncbi:branched-chain amino acid transaminase [Thermorudis peleae]|uniref:branched-chain amino acid transaminase n=1 Tax=Thermorudis peleae TaxID=1382356 RepID=UPI00056E490C|nr:branched-chain amino acid transaminase [Thermorudis peleae]
MPRSELLPYAFFEGQIVPSDQAKVSIATHALQYGTGVFGGIRGYLTADGQAINVFRLPDHTRRLMQSARFIRATLPYDADGVAQIIVELIKRNAPRFDVYIRPFIYKADLELGPKLRGIRDELAIYLIPLQEYLPVTKPIRVMVSSWRRVEDNIIPSRGKVSGAYVNSALAHDQAEEAGFDDAIMLNAEGKVAEASGANIFIVRNGTLITSPITADILEGITRRTIIQYAHDLGIPVEEREIDRTELYICDEIFLCGTGAQISPVGVVDGRTVGNGEIGPITKRLQELFFAVVRGEEPRYQHFLTRVPLE